MSVAFFRNQPSGCYWYRIKHPTDLLSANGVKVIPMTLNDTVDESDSYLLYGAYPFSIKPALDKLKKDGKKLVLDMDDALGLIEESNPMYSTVHRDLGSHYEMIELADEFTVATPKIGEYVSKLAPGKMITIIPNCYDPKEWTFERPKREGIRIGFAGSSTHVQDVIPLLPVIKKLQDKYDIKFLLFGFGKSTYEKWFYDQRFYSTPKGKQELETFNKLLLEIKYEWVPFVDFESYPATLTNMALDIGLCPLNSSPFNDCRSASKAMEYTLSGALALASDAPPYRLEPTATIVNDWEKALTHFIENPEDMKNFHQKNLKWLEENRQMSSQLSKLKEIYEIHV